MGTFRVYQKHITTTMDSSVADHEFELRDVPWVMYFDGSYALHGAGPQGLVRKQLTAP